MDLNWSGSVVITAPVAAVYAYLADFPRHSEWAQTVERLELVRPGDTSGVGARYLTTERQAMQADRRPYAPLRRGADPRHDLSCAGASHAACDPGRPRAG